MTKTQSLRPLFAFLTMALLPTGARADRGPDAEGEDGRARAPYFFMEGGDPKVDRLPLKETSADVQVAGAIAHVRVNQIFQNDGDKPIEAIYVFPASTRAAVHGMRMRIGDRLIDAKIDRKQEARRDYDEARREGRRASLLEQERANVFRMSVANVMPHDRIEVLLDYSEMLVPDKGIYEFVFPGVVGPRYPARQGSTDRDRWIGTPVLREGEPAPFAWDVRVHIESGVPLRDVSSPSHAISVARPSPTSADVRLAEPGRGDRDYVLRYRLAGDRIETGLLLYKGESENFFALMMEPPRRSSPADVAPREFVFLADVSGSMNGFPLETAKTLMRNLLRGLRPTDRFNVVLFSGRFDVMERGGSIPATADNLARAERLIDAQQGGGGTELMGGLEAVYDIPRDPTLARTVVVITDGFVDVEAESFRLIREHLGEANLFAFGIGSSVNRAIIEGMARAGFGEPYIVESPEKAEAEAEKLRTCIDRPLLAHIGVSFRGFGAYDLVPARLPDLLAERPLILFGKYRGAPKGLIEIQGETGTGPFHRTVAVESARELPGNAVLRWLWARKQAETLGDDLALRGADPELRGRLAELGLRYSLLTPETSFVAIDRVVANMTGTLAEAPQPLPLPAGVSNLAVRAAVSLSRDEMPPGDPIITVAAPPTAKQVTAFFPFGLVKDLAWDRFTSTWQTRFLVPKDVPDGEYRVPVLVVHADGRAEALEATYRIDSSEPDFEVTVEPTAGGARITVTTADPARLVTVALVADPSVRVELKHRGDRLHFEGALALPSGTHRLRVVVADRARNEAEHLIACEVP